MDLIAVSPSDTSGPVNFWTVGGRHTTPLHRNEQTVGERFPDR